jgi:hypothetical protein
MLPVLGRKHSGDVRSNEDGRVWQRGEAPDIDRDLRAFCGVLRCLLQKGAAGVGCGNAGWRLPPDVHAAESGLQRFAPLAGPLLL